MGVRLLTLYPQQMHVHDVGQAHLEQT